MPDYSQYTDEDLKKMLEQSTSKGTDYSQYSDEDLMKMLQEDKQEIKPNSLIDKLGNRVSNIGKEITNYPGGIIGPGDPVHVLGQVAGGINDIATSAAKGIYNTVVPQQARQAIGDFANEAFSEENPIGGALASMARGVGKFAKSAQENYPETSKYAGDALNIAGAIPIVKGVTGLSKGIVNLGKEGISTVKNATLQNTTEYISKMPQVAKDALIKRYDNEIDKIVNSGLSGTIGNKAKSVSQSISEKAKRTQAIESIIKDTDVNFPTESGGISQIPKTVDEMAQAIDMRKSNLWKKDIAPLLESTGGDVTGYKVPVTNSIKALDDIITDRSLIGGTVVKQAEKFKASLSKIQSETGGFSIEEAQNFIKNANARLRTYYNKVNPALDTDLAMRANIAKEIRQNLDDKVMKSTGGSLDSLKREYGSLLSIEEDVNKLRNKAARLMSNKNIPSYMDMATDWSMLHHGIKVLQGASPTSFIPSAVMKGVNTYRKYLMNPDTKISKMFTEAEKFVSRKDMVKGTIPKPGLIPSERQITYARQMPLQDVSGQPSGYTPPLPRPTTKAIGYEKDIPDRMGNYSVPIKLGMLDDSSIKAVKGTFNNPTFWSKNQDLTNLRLKIANNKPMIMDEWNTLLERIMMNRMGSDINSRIPLKSSLSDILQNTGNQY